MASNRTRAVFMITGGIALIVPASLVFFVGVPHIYAPFPVALIFPLFMVSEMQPHALAMVLCGLVVSSPTLLFWFVGCSLFRGVSRPPLHTLIVALGLGILNVWWLVGGWAYGLRWQGPAHTIAVTILNLLLYAAAVFLIIKARRHPSFTLNYLGHWVMFLWLAWYSFPYLGELP